jgi:hypothetical protein
MELNQFIVSTGFTPEDAAAVMQSDLSMADYERLRTQFELDTDAFLSEMRRQPNFRLQFLVYAVHYAMDLYPLFVRKNISDIVYYDTFSELAIWAGNCRRLTGTLGIENIEWVSRSLQMRIFRLGRLQFEPATLSESYRIAGRVLNAGTLVLNVHIPQGSPLRKSECEASYRQALSFFHGIMPAFFCRSWLLYPALNELLPEYSNILAFQKPYQILETDDFDRQAEERLFGTLSDDPTLYPQITVLQSKARARLISGKPVGSALGVYLPE